MSKILMMALCGLALSMSLATAETAAAPGGERYELEPAVSEKPVTPKVLRDDDSVKIVLVTIAPGATMPEHATPVPVTVQTLSGAGEMTISGKSHELAVGSIYYLDADAPHALSASGDEALVVLVHYLKGGAPMDHEHG